MDNPNLETLTCKLSGCEGIEIRTAAFDSKGKPGRRALVNSLQIKGKPEQLIALADKIYEAFGKSEVKKDVA